MHITVPRRRFGALSDKASATQGAAKRALLAGPSALAIVLSLAGCGGGLPQPAQQTIRPPNAPGVPESPAIGQASENESGVLHLPLGPDALRSRAAQPEDAYPDRMVGPVTVHNAPAIGVIEALAEELGLSVTYDEADVGRPTITAINLAGRAQQVLHRICGLASLHCSLRDGSLELRRRGTFVIDLPPTPGSEDNSIAATIGMLIGEDPTKDPSGGFLVYRADVQQHRQVVQYLEQLRNGRPLIVFQMHIWEVILNEDNQAGIRWNNLSYGRRPAAGQEGGLATITDNLARVNNAFNVGAVFSAGRITADIIANFLGSQGAVQNVQRPQLTFISGSRAELFVGEKEKYVSQVGTLLNTGLATGGAASPTTPGATPGVTGVGANTVQTDTLETGTRIEISGAYQDGSVVAALKLSIKELIEMNTANSGTATIMLPKTAEKTSEAMLRVRPGDSVILSGLNSARQEGRRQGIAGMQNQAPMYRRDNGRNTEVVVLVRPIVLTFGSTPPPGAERLDPPVRPSLGLNFPTIPAPGATQSAPEPTAAPPAVAVPPISELPQQARPTAPLPATVSPPARPASPAAAPAHARAGSQRETASPSLFPLPGLTGPTPAAAPARNTQPPPPLFSPLPEPPARPPELDADDRGRPTQRGASRQERRANGTAVSWRGTISGSQTIALASLAQSEPPRASSLEAPPESADPNVPVNRGPVGPIGLVPLESTISMGNVPAGQQRRQRVILRNTSERPIRVLSVSPEEIGNVTVTKLGDDCSDLGTIASGQRCGIVLNIAPAAEGPFSLDLLVTHDGPERLTTVRLQGTATARPAQATSTQVDQGLRQTDFRTTGADFGTVRSPGIISRTVLLRNVTSEQLKVSSVDLIQPPPSLTIREGSCQSGSMLSPDDTCPITLLWNPTENGDLISEVLVQHDGPGRFTLIPVKGAAQVPALAEEAAKRQAEQAAREAEAAATAAAQAARTRPASNDMSPAMPSAETQGGPPPPPVADRAPALAPPRVRAEARDGMIDGATLVGTVGLRAIFLKNGTHNLMRVGESIGDAEIVAVRGGQVHLRFDDGQLVILQAQPGPPGSQAAGGAARPGASNGGSAAQQRAPAAQPATRQAR